MPSLLRLSVAFNFISSLDGLQESVSHLVYLDVRGNLISRRSDILDPIQRLSALQSILVGGTQPNPICKNIPVILELFNSIPSLISIDKRGREEWDSMQSQPPLSAAVSTPHFDKILNKFRTGKAKLKHSISPRVGVSRLPASQLNSPHRAERLPFNVSDASVDPNYLLLPTYGTPKGYRSSSAANAKVRLWRDDQVGGYHHQGSPGNDWYQSPPKASPSNLSHALDPSTDAYENALAEDHLHSQQQLLKLQYALLVCEQREEKARLLRLVNSFMRWKHFSTEYRSMMEDHDAADVINQHQRELNDLRKAAEDDAVLHKQQYDRLYSKYLQQDTALALLRQETEALTDEQQYQLSTLRTENLQLANELRLEQERLHGIRSQYELAEKEHTRAIQSALEEGVVKIKELEVTHASIVSQHDITQAELTYCKLRLAESDASSAKLRNTCTSLESEVISLQTRLQSVASSLKAAEDELELKRDHIDKLQREQISSTSMVDNTLTAFQDQLCAVNSQLDTFREKESSLNEAKEKLEMRLKKLQLAFEGVSASYSKLQQDYDDLSTSHNRDVLTIKELSKCVKRLQQVLELQQTNCKRCADTDKLLSEANKKYAESHEVCNRRADEIKEMEAKHRRVERLHSEAIDNIERMQRDIAKLEFQVQSTDSNSRQLVVGNQQKEQSIKKLEMSLKVKEAMLEDQSTELFDLRSRLQHELTQFKRCKRDFDDAVEALSDKLREKETAVSGLESELLKKSHTEVKLKELIKEYQRVDRIELANDDEDEDEAAADSNGLTVSFDFMGTPSDSPESLTKRRTTKSCSNKQCCKEKDQLMRDVKGKYLQLMELKKDYERLSALKSEEATKFNAALVCKFWSLVLCLFPLHSHRHIHALD